MIKLSKYCVGVKLKDDKQLILNYDALRKT